LFGGSPTKLFLNASSDDGAREMKHAQEIVEPVFPPDCKAAVILEPRKQAFGFTPATVAAESSAILRAILAIASVWRNHLDSGLGEIFVQTIRIVGVVTDQTFYWLGGLDPLAGDSRPISRKNPARPFALLPHHRPGEILQ
jgi:hypothetical protein